MSTLGDDLARLLASEPFGLSGRQVARRVHRRWRDVFVVLRDDGRFVHDGRGRGSRWCLARWGGAAGMPQATVQATMGKEDMPWLALDASGVPIVGRRAVRAS